MCGGCAREKLSYGRRSHTFFSFVFYFHFICAFRARANSSIRPVPNAANENGIHQRPKNSCAYFCSFAAATSLCCSTFLRSMPLFRLSSFISDLFACNLRAADSLDDKKKKVTIFPCKWRYFSILMVRLYHTYIGCAIITIISVGEKKYDNQATPNEGFCGHKNGRAATQFSDY